MAKKQTIPKLRAKAQKLFNAFIRERDKDETCISCETGRIENACHYYAAGSVPSMAFDEDNVHGGCVGCNKWKAGNLIEYRKGLVERYGERFVKRLDKKSEDYKLNGWKWEREYLNDIIEKYK